MVVQIVFGNNSCMHSPVLFPKQNLCLSMLHEHFLVKILSNTISLRVRLSLMCLFNVSVFTPAFQATSAEEVQYQGMAFLMCR
ncbi:hypothetical protein RHMOL_Rhmol13G0262900 [Rhododendron molle]|uniref:Uncharacterized protein n=1 Tax=Rhododendron molle TaxID=49168 RepID=A0ACC0LBZ0_RHOML|nr:hypothetical protein RHMOL_Rhmol13G0262900 [Rhododendron molle]